MEKRAGGLDFLRVLACLGIVFLHFSNHTCPDGVYFGSVLVDPECDLLNLNGLVELFFCISGYLIYKYGEKIRSGMKFKDFIIPRLIRIIPMLAISTIAYVGVQMFFVLWENGGKGSYQIDLWGLISGCLGVEYHWAFKAANINPTTWFLDVLILCFVLYYFCVWSAQRFRLNENIMFVLMVLIGAACYTKEFDLPFLYLNNGRGYEAFFSGVLLASYLSVRERSKGIYVLSILSIGIYMVNLFFWPQNLIAGKAQLLSFFVSPALIILFSAPAVSGVFGGKVWELLGKSSFSVYVIHETLLMAIVGMANMCGYRVDYSHEVMFFAFAIMAFLLGILMYLLVEKPLAYKLMGMFRKDVELDA